MDVQRSSLTNDTPGRRSRSLSSVRRCLALIDALAEHPAAAGPAELARATGSSRSVVHQQLQTLVEAGWVERVGESGVYRLALRTAHLVDAALEQASFGSRAAPLLMQLAQKSGEAVSLAVLERGSALIVQRVESRYILRADLSVGTRMPLANTASGEVLLAFGHASRLACIEEQHCELPSAEILEHVRSRGIAVHRETAFPDISAIAAPVRDRTGFAVAALSVAGPPTRFSVEDWVEEVLECARSLEISLYSVRLNQPSTLSGRRQEGQS